MLEMDSALYYTFSTIAQTLAAAIALLAAFLLYRLQSLNAGMQTYSGQTAQHYGGPDRRQLDELQAQGRYETFVRYHTKHPAPSGDEHTLTPRTRLVALLSQRKSIFRLFYTSLGLTVVVVTASVGVLAITPLITNSACAWLILAAGASGFLICLLSYVFLVKDALA